jgi:hypothetical protein
MTHQEATIKAVKLLRLAQSSNENEAALAMSRAQELIDRHKLTNLSLDLDTENPPEDIINFTHDPLDEGSAARATWRWRLALGIASTNQCKLYGYGKRLILVGRPSDATAVRYLYGWMVREIERLAAAKCAGCGRTFWNNFRIGAANAVRDRLVEHQQETFAAVKNEAAAESQGSTLALVRVNNAIAKLDKRMDEVRDWTKKNIKLVKVTRSQGRNDPTARELGYAAGKTIPLRHAAGALANPTKQLQGAV